MPVRSLVVPGNGPRPTEAKLADAAAVRTALAECLLRLFKASDGEIVPATTAADMDAFEADFSGYTAGGVEIATAGEPYVDEDGKVYITLPSVQFNHSGGGTPVVNEIGGAYVVDAAGKLRGAADFAAPVTMANASNSLVVTFTLEVL